MPLSGSVEKAEPGIRGFDTNASLAAGIVAEAHAQGYRFCVRFLSRESGSQLDGMLTATEAELILAGGLALMPIQLPRYGGLKLSGSMGIADGNTAASNASKIGFPGGVCVWCDLEGVEVGTEPARVVDYCNAWHAAVLADGYIPGLYVGSHPGLEAGRFAELLFEAYWRSAGTVVDIPGRGFRMIQDRIDIPLEGTRLLIDTVTTAEDQRGGRVAWLAP